MDLQPGHAENDLRTFLLELVGERDIGLLVESGLELDDDRNVFPVAGSVDERIRDARMASHAVQSHFDLRHFRIDRGLT